MQSIEALENIFTSDIKLLDAFANSDIITIDQENKTISLTYNYDKDDIQSKIDTIQSTLDSYLTTYQDEGDVLYLKDFIVWLRNLTEQLQNFKETL